MAKKDRTFAAKVAKSASKELMGKHCPACGELFNIVQVVSSEKSEIDTWKFKEKIVSVCKCNQNEVYG